MKIFSCSRLWKQSISKEMSNDYLKFEQHDQIFRPFMPLITKSIVYWLSKNVYSNRRNRDILQMVIWVFFCGYHKLILVHTILGEEEILEICIDNMLQQWKRTFDKSICFMWAQNVNFTPLHCLLKNSIEILLFMLHSWNFGYM
jgi:hypothetical protein